MIFFAGFPNIETLELTFLITTLPAPTTTSSPIFLPGITFAPTPKKHPDPTFTLPVISTFPFIEVKSPITASWPMVEFVLIKT